MHKIILRSLLLCAASFWSSPIMAEEVVGRGAVSLFRPPSPSLVPRVGDSFLVQKKDPSIAVLMSLVFPGLGQAYNGDSLKGSMIFVLHTAAIISVAGMVAFHSSRERPMGSYSFVDLSAVSKSVMISVILGDIFVYISSVIDAYFSAKSDNKRSLLTASFGIGDRFDPYVYISFRF